GRCQTRRGGDDVDGITGSQLGDAHDNGIEGVNPSADHVLQCGDELCQGWDRVDGRLRLGAVAAAAVDRDLEDVRTGLERPWAGADDSPWARIHMCAEGRDRPATRRFEYALFDHDR